MASFAPEKGRVRRQERAIVIGAIAVLAALAWLWTWLGAGMPMGAEAMPGMKRAGPPLALALAMWWVMMMAMMLPSAMPVVLLYGRVRRMHQASGAVAPSGIFLAGYMLAWLAASAFAAEVQIIATRVGLLDPMTMAAMSPAAAGAALLAIGLYQFSPTKDACLAHCRSPAAFLARHWRPGIRGALRLGLLHGGYCIGCCWLLMFLLFVGGVMNFAWIAGVTALVAAEKLLPGARWVPRSAGVIAIAWGAGMVLSGTMLR